MIMSSDREFTLWPKAGTELTLDLAHSSFTIPVVGGTTALDKAECGSRERAGPPPFDGRWSGAHLRGPFMPARFLLQTFGGLALSVRDGGEACPRQSAE
jgi:hypothetical protein